MPFIKCHDKHFYDANAPTYVAKLTQDESKIVWNLYDYNYTGKDKYIATII